MCGVSKSDEILISTMKEDQNWLIFVFCKKISKLGDNYNTSVDTTGSTDGPVTCYKMENHSSCRMKRLYKLYIVWCIQYMKDKHTICQQFQ